MLLTDELIRERHLERWTTHVGTDLGNWDAIWHCQERLRADYVCQIASRDNIPLATALAQYAVTRDVMAELLGEIPTPARKPKRSDRRQAILDWAANNIELSVTTAQLAELFDISQSTASKYTQEHPDVFRALKRGHFQIRDPKADREQDKKAQP